MFYNPVSANTTQSPQHAIHSKRSLRAGPLLPQWPWSQAHCIPGVARRHSKAPQVMIWLNSVTLSWFLDWHDLAPRHKSEPPWVSTANHGWTLPSLPMLLRLCWLTSAFPWAHQAFSSYQQPNLRKASVLPFPSPCAYHSTTAIQHLSVSKSLREKTLTVEQNLKVSEMYSLVALLKKQNLCKLEVWLRRTILA